MEDRTQVQQTTNNDISLRELILYFQDWFKFLKSKWIKIFIIVLVGATIGFTYATLKKPIYAAQLSFAIEDDKGSGGIGNALGIASQFGIDLLGGGGGSVFTGDNLLELMRSRSMIEKTLLTPVNIKGKTITLAEYYISFNKFREAWESDSELRNLQFLPNISRSKFSLKQDSVLGVFYNAIIKTNLSVDKSDKKLSIINLKVISGNELFSKLFVEILAKTVSDFYVTTKTKQSAQNVMILQHQTDSVRRELNAAIYGVASSIDATPNVNPGRQVLRASTQHRQVDVQANQAILTELVKNLEVSKVSLRKETPLIQVIDAPILPLEKTKLGRLKGAFFGAFIAGVLTVLFFIVKRSYENIMKEPA